MEAKLKHLEFIQSVINRMAQNSSMFKGWAITIAAGLSAFAATNTEHALLGMALVSTAMFWGLDGYYLWLERCFIELYADVARKPEAEIDFQMPIDKSQSVQRWLRNCVRPHNLFFYGSIIVFEGIAIFVLTGSKCG